jgi:hypothetical protein
VCNEKLLKNNALGQSPWFLTVHTKKRTKNVTCCTHAKRATFCFLQLQNVALLHHLASPKNEGVAKK